MYFNDRFCNPQYVNPLYYAQQQERIRQMKQDDDAARDLCKAVKNMDEEHQQQAFWACLCVVAEEYGWGSAAI